MPAAKGFDVSNWDSGLDFRNAGIDFLIYKVTEGTRFVDKDAVDFRDQCRRYHLQSGFYHFAGGADPRTEADFFHAHSSSFDGVPILDYEINLEHISNVDWCEQFIQRYYEITGKYCMLYISAYRCSQYVDSWIPSKCALWIAGYPFPYETWLSAGESCNVPYNTYPWSKAAVWQFTSSFKYQGHNIDANYCYDPFVLDCVPPDTTKTIEILAREVINGKWGNGNARKVALTNAGYDYDTVQKRVNEILAPKSVDVLAREVIIGKWGNGEIRRRALTNAGYDYNAVQKRVNQLLGVW